MRARGRTLEPVPARGRARCGPDQPRIRAAVRDHGPFARVRRKSSTAPRPIPATWKCWSATARRATGAMAEAAAGRRDPLLFRDDGAGVALGRHQHRSSIVREGDEYVINGRKWYITGAPTRGARSSSSWARPTPTTPGAPAAVDDPGTDGHARREDRALLPRVRLCRRALRPRRDRVRERARAGANICWAKAAARDRARAAGTGPHPPLHAAIGLADARWK